MTATQNALATNTPTPHILIVEDDPAIATSLRVTFKREGWQVTWLDNASSVIPTLQSFNQQNHSISGIVLDVGLPDGDGLNLCQDIRHSDEIGLLKQLPIIFLTARSDEVDRILGLEMGGDDYCPKPFSPRELVARLKAIWRREQLTASNIDNQNLVAEDGTAPQIFELESGVWRYEPLTYTLYWNDNKLELSNTERKLLLALLANPERVFSREQLLNSISDYPDHRLARTIDSHVKSIRKQLAQISDDDQEIIHTHRGLGYGLCAS
ncbi:response regulator transcription factor [Psychrobacter sanguinis]|uniref:response regulator transcription factor n=1 Tax=Psychrobacter sanguinis TaxID=861445 RepID=UPI00191810EE|nr:response regulator transcription factor [Psychrobacter sanguinis]MCC3307999.1 response regulator transcription factor [Psychrobacter sanguinis]MCC3344235.1 response regulator transcription factor [Psychrobacter sanguinis]MDY3306238.1 response regulator transcription factor [Psychrobacter sanguinis]